MEKQCKVCEQVLPLDRFPIRRDKRLKDRVLHRSECKKCTGRYNRAWGKKNDTQRLFDRLRVNLLRRGGGTPPTRAELRSIDDGSCYICGGDLAGEPRELDHKKPRSKGGMNNIENLAWAHRSCNRMKHAHDFDSFLDRIAMILKRHRGA